MEDHLDIEAFKFVEMLTTKLQFKKMEAESIEHILPQKCVERSDLTTKPTTAKI